jgi:hypothetical protein
LDAGHKFTTVCISAGIATSAPVISVIVQLDAGWPTSMHPAAETASIRTRDTRRMSGFFIILSGYVTSAASIKVN